MPATSRILCTWASRRLHTVQNLAGLFEGITAVLAGVLAFALILIKLLVTKWWSLIRS